MTGHRVLCWECGMPTDGKSAVCIECSSHDLPWPVLPIARAAHTHIPSSSVHDQNSLDAGTAGGPGTSYSTEVGSATPQNRCSDASGPASVDYGDGTTCDEYATDEFTKFSRMLVGGCVVTLAVIGTASILAAFAWWIID